MSEEQLGYIGSLQARWTALVTVLVDKGLITQEEILAALEREVKTILLREEEALEDEAEECLDDDEEHDEDAGLL